MFEIYGQRLDDTGNLLGSAVRISDMGPDGDPASAALKPAMTYNPLSGEYLEIWQGDDTTDNTVEIYGQRLAVDGSEIGTNDARLSDMGADDADTSYRGQELAVAWGSAHGECLVVWEGSDDTSPLIPGEFEIFGQRLAADGSEVGANDARLSDMGANGDPAYGAHHPAVAYGLRGDEYMVSGQAMTTATSEADLSPHVNLRCSASVWRPMGAKSARMTNASARRALMVTRHTRPMTRSC